MTAISLCCYIFSVQLSGHLAAIQLSRLLVQMQRRVSATSLGRDSQGKESNFGNIDSVGGGVLKPSPIKTSGFRDDAEYQEKESVMSSRQLAIFLS